MHRTRRAHVGLLAVSLAAFACACRGAIDTDAQRSFRREIGRASVVVFPARLTGADPDSDPAAAPAIAEALDGRGLLRAHASQVVVPLPAPAHETEWNRARASALAFGDWARTHALGAQYGLLPEYLFGNGVVGAVHYYVVDEQGRVADVGGWNSHHELFRECAPVDAQQCTALLIRGLAERWRVEAPQPQRSK